MVRPVLIVLIAVAGLAAAIFVLFDRGFLRFNYPSQARFPVRGIDVSHHQGAIDWPAVARNGDVHFAYIKATEGGDFKDRAFAANWAGARAAGIVRGAYHFFTFCRDGKTQATNLLGTVPDEGGTLPVAIDLEFDGNCAARPAPEALATEVRDFIAAVQAQRPYRPVLYVTPQFYDRYMKDYLALYPEHVLWWRNIVWEPRQRSCERWSLWQFAHRGRRLGISDPVDLNVACSAEEFAALVASTSR